MAPFYSLLELQRNFYCVLFFSFLKQNQRIKSTIAEKVNWKLKTFCFSRVLKLGFRTDIEKQKNRKAELLVYFNTESIRPTVSLCNVQCACPIIDWCNEHTNMRHKGGNELNSNYLIICHWYSETFKSMITLCLNSKYFKGYVLCRINITPSNFYQELLGLLTICGLFWFGLLTLLNV